MGTLHCLTYHFQLWKLNEHYSKDNITSVILMGGHSRVPIVQAAVREVVGEYVASLGLRPLFPLMQRSIEL